VISRNLGRPRTALIVVAVFAGAALLLAAIGIHGVLSYSVALRTREMGIRLALGSSAAGLHRLVVKESMLLVIAGALLGLPIAAASGRLYASLLFDITPNDPRTLATVIVVLATAALIASYPPARRATQTDPMQVLRSE